ncbi:MAG: DMT family transporter [Francisellaceae bacterium]|jgi:drug/metabolite transporter (DMT)-like permease|nr:DMT family transporter [Francisellaceae bacterium]MBT6207978.1 DMT family transporter [Francisellaceae bacterium]MBT6538475.1 DMT family transporter [Francisellaceae bacterium]
MHLVLLLFALFASLFTLQKEALSYSEPFFLIGSRMAFAGVLLLAFYFLKNGKLDISKRHIKPLVILGVTNIYLTNICEIWGLNNMGSAKTCLIYSLSPFVAAFVAYILLGEQMNKKKWYGMFIGIIGLIPIFYTQTEQEISAGKFWFISYAELSILGAVIFSVYGWITLKDLMQNHKMSPILANGASMLLGGTLALIHSYTAGEAWTPVPILKDVEMFIVYAAVLCIISNIICYNLYGHLLKRFSATFMSFSGLTTPLFASLFGWLLLNEEITWHYLAAIAFFSVGLYIFYIEEPQTNTKSQVTNDTKEEIVAS